MYRSPPCSVDIKKERSYSFCLDLGVERDNFAFFAYWLNWCVLVVKWVITPTVSIFKGKNVCVLEFCFVSILLSWSRSRFESVASRQ